MAKAQARRLHPHSGRSQTRVAQSFRQADVYPDYLHRETWPCASGDGTAHERRWYAHSFTGTHSASRGNIRALRILARQPRGKRSSGNCTLSAEPNTVRSSDAKHQRKGNWRSLDQGLAGSLHEVYSRWRSGFEGDHKSRETPRFHDPQGDRQQRRVFLHRVNSHMATATTPDLFKLHERTPPASRKQLDNFDERFSRCHNTLRYIARRILGDCWMIERALENCWFRASRNPPKFESEGAFRSWVVRLLINEAALLLHRNRAATSEENVIAFRKEGRQNRK
jgi:hypothetical protein